MQPVHQRDLHRDAAGPGDPYHLDGHGAWRNNFFAERLWRSVKYEEVYLQAYDSVRDARASLGRYLAFHNGRRPQSSLGARTPEQAYLDHLPSSMAA